MRIFLLLLIFVFGVMNNESFGDPGLADLQWKNRVLVILAPSENDPLLKRERATAAGDSSGFLERDLTLVVETAAGPLHRKFDISGDQFQVLLVGKDGHLARSWATPVGSEELFSIIDAMPMRQDEIRRRKKD
jgi:hypothetical protein